MDPELVVLMQAHEVLKSAIGTERYGKFVKRKYGREYVERCRALCTVVGIEPDAPPGERRDTIVGWLRTRLSYPEAKPFEIDRAAGMQPTYRDLLQLAACPNEIRAEDAGRVFTVDFRDGPQLSETESASKPTTETEALAAGFLTVDARGIEGI